MRKYKNYILSFAIPFMILLIVFGTKGLFGNIDNIIVSDLRQQHTVFLNYFRNIILGNTSIHYSFAAGIGSPMIATVIFYCLSPVNILLFFIKDIRYAVIFIYMTKVSLSGLSMYIFLNWKFKKSDISTVVFSISYSLCSFVINYYFCIFWFDCLYLAPLIIIGIERIFKEEKINLLYIFSLSLAIICNIQMGYELCFFSVIYFIYLFNIKYSFDKNYKKFKKLLFLFIISSLCVGGICSGVLLGFLSMYGDISSAREALTFEVSAVSNIGYILKNLFTINGGVKSYFNNYEPFIYSGLIVSVYSVLYFFNRKISKKKRVHAFFVILIFFISFCLWNYNLFWQLSEPILLNFRYSYCLILFLIMISYESYINCLSFSNKDKVVLVVILLISIITLSIYDTEVSIRNSFIFIMVYGLLFFFMKKRKGILEYILLFFMVVEIGINAYTCTYTAEDMPFDYSSFDNQMLIAKNEKISKDYRIIYNFSFFEDANDSLFFYDTSSLRYFSSTIYGKVISFFSHNYSRMGSNNYVISAYDSPLLLSLMGNKYFYTVDKIDDYIYKNIDVYSIDNYDYYKKKTRKYDVYLYDNPYALSLGYMIDKDVKYRFSYDNVDYQNEIIKTITNTNEDVLIKLDREQIKNSDICADSVYLNCEVIRVKRSDINNKMFLSANTLTFSLLSSDMESEVEDNVYFDEVIQKLVVTDEDVVIVISSDSEIVGLSFYTYDEELLKRDLDILRENMISNIKFKKNMMTSKINANKDGILLLTIPYDDRFSVYVDGKKTNYYGLYEDTFIGLDVKKGNHDIKLVYTDNRIYIYMISSVIFIIITLILKYFINKKKVVV